MSDSQVPDDPFAEGIGPWAASVRRGETGFRRTVDTCLERIEASASLNAFECLDTERARAAADAFDTLLAAGTDLGPLMGVPFGVKDIMAVDGLPLTNGSNADTTGLVGGEGALVRTLKRAGAIVIGKTCTVEFALGATGVNEARGTPWNPLDRDVQRLPGGSSSGSAVAVSAGLVGFALGTDTGGSVRIPACFTGIVGHKSSVGRWPTDGIFPLSPTLDSPGSLCRGVADAVLLHEAVSGEPAAAARSSVAGLRFGVPRSLFLDELDREVSADFEMACSRLIEAGAVRVDIDVPEAHERSALFPAIVAPELLATLGVERFRAIRGGMDSVTASRAAVGLTVDAVEHARAQARRRELVRLSEARFEGLDLWLTPTCPFLPMSVASLSDRDVHARSLLASRNTQPANLFSQCGMSLPIGVGPLPSGLQLLAPWGEDARLLSLAGAIARTLDDASRARAAR